MTDNLRGTFFKLDPEVHVFFLPDENLPFSHSKTQMFTGCANVNVTFMEPVYWCAYVSLAHQSRGSSEFFFVNGSKVMETEFRLVSVVTHTDKTELCCLK